MIYLKLPPFNPVANGVRSTLQIPRYDMTLGRVVLTFPGTNSITKATISEIVIKIGPRVVFGPISGAELDAINKYKGIFDKADALTIDLTERDGLTILAKEIGGIDIPALGGQDIFTHFQDIFSELFGGFAGGGFAGGGQRRSRGPGRGQDLRVEQRLTLREAMTGTKPAPVRRAMSS